MILGITGGVGSGKSTVTDLLFEKYGFLVLKTDDIAKMLEQPGELCYRALVEAFGESILEADPGTGTGADAARPIDKAAFAEKIYSDPKALELAESIIHPATWAYVEDVIRREYERREQKPEGKVSDEVRIAVETALPGERYRGMCDEIWFVYVEREERIRRLMESRGYSREKCESIMKEQISDEAYISWSDYIVDNTGDLKAMGERVEELMQRPEADS